MTKKGRRNKRSTTVRNQPPPPPPSPSPSPSPSAPMEEPVTESVTALANEPSSPTSRNEASPPPSPPHPLPAAFNLSQPERAKAGITNLVNMYTGLERIKEELLSIAAAPDNNTEPQEGDSSKQSRRSQRNKKSNVEHHGDSSNVAGSGSLAATVQDVASGGNQGGTGISTSAGTGAVRKDEDNAGLNVFEKAKNKAAKKKTKKNKKKQQGS